MVEATMTGVELRTSKRDKKDMYMLFFKKLIGSTLTYAVPGNRNFPRWDKAIKAFREGKRVTIQDYKEKRLGLMDADFGKIVIDSQN